MEPLHTPDASTLRRFLIDGVKEIDRRLCKVGDRVESGFLCTIEQLAADALRETGKRYKDESLVAWLLAARLREAGLEADVEKHPLDLGDRCDLMVHLGDGKSIGVEIKFAWKVWLSTDHAKQTGRAYEAHFSANATPTLDKLEAAPWPEARAAALLLIGFDHVEAPMDAEIAGFQQRQSVANRGWKLTAHEAWPDQRDPGYRIACWFWQREPHTVG